MPEAIEYAVDRPVAPEAVAELFRAAGLRRPVDEPERIARMVANASLILSAWHGDRLVGIARSVTDFAFCCYLSDLAIHPEFQRQGIGKELVHRTKAQIGEECMLLLLSVPDAMEYYPHIGMEKIDRAFIIHRSR